MATNKCIRNVLILKQYIIITWYIFLQNPPLSICYVCLGKNVRHMSHFFNPEMDYCAFYICLCMCGLWCPLVNNGQEDILFLLSFLPALSFDEMDYILLWFCKYYLNCICLVRIQYIEITYNSFWCARNIDHTANTCWWNY